MESMGRAKEEMERAMKIMKEEMGGMEKKSAEYYQQMLKSKENF